MVEEQLKIPKERIAILIGTKGKERRRLEQLTKCKILIDSKEGDVILRGEAVDVFHAEPVIKAIARGFPPDIANELANEDNTFILIEMKDFAGRNKNDMKRMKSRIIGTGGKCRQMIEELTGCQVRVYGKTIGIIGSYEMADIAQEAVENILRGSRHGNVYARVESRKKKLFEQTVIKH